MITATIWLVWMASLYVPHECDSESALVYLVITTLAAICATCAVN